MHDQNSNAVDCQAPHGKKLTDRTLSTGASDALPFRIECHELLHSSQAGQRIFQIMLGHTVTGDSALIGEVALELGGPPVVLDRIVQVSEPPGVRNFIDSVHCVLQLSLINNGPTETLRLTNSIRTSWTIGELDIDLIGVDTVTPT